MITVQIGGNTSDVLLQVYNIFGQLLLEQKDVNTIDTKNYVDGIYYIVLKTNTLTYTEKFKIQHE
jgi:hypothetical protein